MILDTMPRQKIMIVLKQKIKVSEQRVVTNFNIQITYELVHEISKNVVCATSKASDQPVHTRSLIRSFACCLNILRVLSY